jgi:hypothetical protein
MLAGTSCGAHNSRASRLCLLRSQADVVDQLQWQCSPFSERHGTSVADDGCPHTPVGLFCLQVAWSGMTRVAAVRRLCPTLC